MKNAIKLLGKILLIFSGCLLIFSAINSFLMKSSKNTTEKEMDDEEDEDAEEWIDDL